MNDYNIRKRLQEIVQKSQKSIQKEVAEEALSRSDEDIRYFFDDLLTQGCVSGMVGKLIDYEDTHKFFITYYDEIESLRHEYEKNVGAPITIDGDLMNFFAWFAFEEVARKLALELDIIS